MQPPACLERTVNVVLEDIYADMLPGLFIVDAIDTVGVLVQVYVVPPPAVRFTEPAPHITLGLAITFIGLRGVTVINTEV